MSRDCVLKLNILVFVTSYVVIHCIVKCVQETDIAYIASFLHGSPSMCKEHRTGDGNNNTIALLKFERNGTPPICR